MMNEQTDISPRTSAEPAPLCDILPPPPSPQNCLPSNCRLSMGMECPTDNLNEMIAAMRTSLERDVRSSIQQYTRDAVYEPVFQAEISNMFLNMKILESLRSLLPAELKGIIDTLQQHQQGLLHLRSKSERTEAYLRDRVITCERRVSSLQAKNTNLSETCSKQGAALHGFKERMILAEDRIKDLESKNVEIREKMRKEKSVNADSIQELTSVIADVREELRRIKRHAKHASKTTEQDIERKILKRRISEIESRNTQGANRIKTM